MRALVSAAVGVAVTGWMTVTLGRAGLVSTTHPASLWAGLLIAAMCGAVVAGMVAVVWPWLLGERHDDDRTVELGRLLDVEGVDR